MALPMFVYPNRLEEATFFDDVGDWRAGLPLTNLKDRRVRKVARSVTAATTDTQFSADLGQVRNVSVVSLHGHNLTRDARVRVIGEEVTLSTLLPGSVVSPVDIEQFTSFMVKTGITNRAFYGAQDANISGDPLADFDVNSFGFSGWVVTNHGATDGLTHTFLRVEGAGGHLVRLYCDGSGLIIAEATDGVTTNSVSLSASYGDADEIFVGIRRDGTDLFVYFAEEADTSLASNSTGDALSLSATTVRWLTGNGSSDGGSAWLVGVFSDGTDAAAFTDHFAAGDGKDADDVVADQSTAYGYIRGNGLSPEAVEYIGLGAESDLLGDVDISPLPAEANLDGAGDYYSVAAYDEMDGIQRFHALITFRIGSLTGQQCLMSRGDYNSGGDAQFDISLNGDDVEFSVALSNSSTVRDEIATATNLLSGFSPGDIVQIYASHDGSQGVTSDRITIYARELDADLQPVGAWSGGATTETGTIRAAWQTPTENVPLVIGARRDSSSFTEHLDGDLISVAWALEAGGHDPSASPEEGAYFDPLLGSGAIWQHFVTFREGGAGVDDVGGLTIVENGTVSTTALAEAEGRFDYPQREQSVTVHGIRGDLLDVGTQTQMNTATAATIVMVIRAPSWQEGIGGSQDICGKFSGAGQRCFRLLRVSGELRQVWGDEVQIYPGIDPLDGVARLYVFRYDGGASAADRARVWVSERDDLTGRWSALSEETAGTYNDPPTSLDNAGSVPFRFGGTTFQQQESDVEIGFCGFVDGALDVSVIESLTPYDLDAGGTVDYIHRYNMEGDLTDSGSGTADDGDFTNGITLASVPITFGSGIAQILPRDGGLTQQAGAQVDSPRDGRSLTQTGPGALSVGATTGGVGAAIPLTVTPGDQITVTVDAIEDTEGGTETCGIRTDLTGTDTLLDSHSNAGAFEELTGTFTATEATGFVYLTAEDAAGGRAVFDGLTITARSQDATSVANDPGTITEGGTTFPDVPSIVTTPVYDSGWLDAYPALYPSGSEIWGEGVTTVTPDQYADGKRWPFVHVIAEGTRPVAARVWTIQIDDASHPDGYVEVGRVVIGNAYQPTDARILQGATFDPGLRGERIETERGNFDFRPLDPRRRWAFDFGRMDRSEWDVQMLEFFRAVRGSRQFLFIPDPDQPLVTVERGGLYVLDGSRAPSSLATFLYLQRLQFVEDY